MLLDVVVFGDGGESKVGALRCVWATRRASSPEVLVAHRALVGKVGMWDIGFLHPCFTIEQKDTRLDYVNISKSNDKVIKNMEYRI